MHTSAIVVKGTDALGREFRELTKTVMVNCYGCQYQSAHYPAPNSAVTLEIHRAALPRSPRVAPARVIWVQRPKSYRPLYYVGVELEAAGNVWDIEMPPEDWFPCAEDEDLEVPVSIEENISVPQLFAVPAALAELENPECAAEMRTNLANTASQLTETILLSDGSKHRM